MNTLNVVESVFFAALEQETPEARAGFLDQACGGDANLRRCVERLLNAHPKAEAFLQSPAPGLPAPVDHPPLSEGPGTVIGPYKLLQELGEGGFGVVFLAEQDQPVRRMVALKIIKPGMDSKQVVARFEQERQALALMDHPNIAKVLDAGATDSGRPYFVMELVKGVPITRFCDDNRLTPRQRLSLFVSVCDAVQHAHQKGIIHRDLKPSNVLVAMYDDRPVVKVIDFGVAKAIEQKLTDQTLFTRVGQVIGTLEYMSPEQASLNALDVDTRSDVYALGVLLYELLTGTTPLEKERLQSAAFGEMLRLIREEEVPRPSDRLSRSGQGLPLLAAYRGTESQRLPRLVRGELDWIALRALEKDRARRYGTAASLGADVQRYLNDEAVEACPPSLGYRAGKFARKHRAALTLATTAAALLLLGTAVSAWQALRATRAEAAAREGEQNALDAQDQAQRQAVAARAAREEVRRGQYAMTMSLIQAAWNSNNLSRAAELLDQLRPGPGEEDLRHFEWHYWDRQLHGERRRVRLADQADLPVLSSDGSRAAFRRTTGEGEVRFEVVESATGKVLFWRAMEKAGAGKRVYTPQLSGDGRRLALLTGPSAGEKDGAKVEVWDVNRRERAFSRTLSPDTTRLALDDAGRQLATIEGERGARGADDDRKRTVKVWDVERPDAEPVFQEKVEARMVTMLKFSPDGARLAAAGRMLGGSVICTWDLKTARRRQRKVDKPVSALAFSPDGARLAGSTRPQIWFTEAAQAGREELPVFVLDCTRDELPEVRAMTLALPARPGLPTTRLAFGPEGKFLAVWLPGLPSAHLIDVATGKQVQVIRSLFVPVEVAFARDGARLFTLATDLDRGQSRSHRGLIWQEWGLQPAQPSERPRFVPRTEVVVWSRDRQRQAVYRPQVLENEDDPPPPVITIRDRAGTELVVFRGHDMGTQSVRFSPDGRLVHSHAGDSFRIWEADTGKVVWSYSRPAPKGNPTNVPFLTAFSPDGRLLVRPGATGATVMRFDDLHELFSVGSVTRVFFSPDGRRLLTFPSHSADAKTERKETARFDCRLWDVEAGRVIGTIQALGSGAVFSPDSKVFLVASTGKPGLAVYDSATGDKRCVIPRGDTTELTGLSIHSVFSPDGNRVLCQMGNRFGDNRDTPAVYDLTTGKELFRLEGIPIRPGGLRFAFSPDSRRIVSVGSVPATASRQAWLKLWDAATGRELLSLDKVPGAGPFPRLTFSADGRQILIESPLTPTRSVLDATPRDGVK